MKTVLWAFCDCYSGGLLLAGCATSTPAPATPSAPAGAGENTSLAAPLKWLCGWNNGLDAPTDSKSFLDMRLKNVVYQPLLYFDKGGNWQPRMASKLCCISDGKKVTITWIRVSSSRMVLSSKPRTSNTILRTIRHSCQNGGFRRI